MQFLAENMFALRALRKRGKCKTTAFPRLFEKMNWYGQNHILTSGLQEKASIIPKLSSTVGAAGNQIGAISTRLSPPYTQYVSFLQYQDICVGGGGGNFTLPFVFILFFRIWDFCDYDFCSQRYSAFLTWHDMILLSCLYFWCIFIKSL